MSLCLSIQSCSGLHADCTSHVLSRQAVTLIPLSPASSIALPTPLTTPQLVPLPTPLITLPPTQLLVLPPPTLQSHLQPHGYVFLPSDPTPQPVPAPSLTPQQCSLPTPLSISRPALPMNSPQALPQALVPPQPEIPHLNPLHVLLLVPP